ncbi:MAG: hypothetical protein K1X29_10820 [Bdellovibrionales bacterium]|nr:hypothetical protein [Bdellovibrionales bacterium]
MLKNLVSFCWTVSFSLFITTQAQANSELISKAIYPTSIEELPILSETQIFLTFDYKIMMKIIHLELISTLE